MYECVKKLFASIEDSGMSQGTYRAEMVLVLYSGLMQIDIARGVWGRCQYPEGGSVHSAICSVISKGQDGSEGILNAEQTIETGRKSTTRDFSQL